MPSPLPLSPQSRIFITGIGMVTPLGPDRESSWRGMRNGASAFRWLPDLQCPQAASGRAAATVPFAGARVPDRPGSDRSGRGTLAADPVIRFADSAAAEAVSDAGLDFGREDLDRVGCVVGTSKGGLRSFAAGLRAWFPAGGAGSDEEPDSVEGQEAPDLWAQFQPHAAANAIAARYDLRGAALCPVAACATGLASIARGADLIRDGYCDVVLAGSSDASLQSVLLASFRRMGVLAHGFCDPSAACRPFDRRRNGFLIGEGAAIVVLERAEHARARGARAYAEWLAAGTAADTAHLTGLALDSVSLTHLIDSVLREARLAPDEIDYINLHGTATRQNDLCETRALKQALGRSARTIPCSALKGSIGHLLGAAGSVELAATLLALRDGVIPPTLNLTEPDEECDLDYTPLVGRAKKIETALKLSLGFGGHLVAAVVRAVD